MKCKVIIIDDEKPARDIIANFLSFREDIEIIDLCKNGFEAYQSITNNKPDIVFLDVQMPKLSGFELIEILDDKPLIIFTTAFDEYAIKAFDVNAIDYLMKPFSKNRFFAALDKAIDSFKSEKIVEQSEKINKIIEDSSEIISKIIVKKLNYVKIIKPENIVYISAEDDYVMIHTKDDHYLKNKTMKYFEKNLSSDFLRIHRSVIINLNEVVEIQAYKKETVTVKMSNGSFLNASKSGTIILRKNLH